MVIVWLIQVSREALYKTKHDNIVSPMLLYFLYKMLAGLIIFFWKHTHTHKQEAMVKDTLEKATKPQFNLKAYLKDAYIHPVFKSSDVEKSDFTFEEEKSPLVATTRAATKLSPDVNSSSPVQPYPWFLFLLSYPNLLLHFQLHIISVYVSLYICIWHNFSFSTLDLLASQGRQKKKIENKSGGVVCFVKFDILSVTFVS